MEWKAVPGYEGFYEISTAGQVRNIGFTSSKSRKYFRREPHILRPETTHDGYKRVVLSKNGIKNKFSVHRLVAVTFIPNPLNLPQVNHIDENPANNQLENLQWCTGKENCNHGLHCERIVKRQINNPYRSISVCQHTMSGHLVAQFPSMREAERYTGVASEQISRCCKGLNRHAGGYIWKYQPINPANDAGD